MNEESLFSHRLAKASKGYLSDDEVFTLVKRYQEENCPKAMSKIVLNYSNLCMSVANRYKAKFEIEDLYQQGMEILIHSLKDFDPTLGFSFGSYVSLALRRGINFYAIMGWSVVKMPQTKPFLKAFRRMGTVVLNGAYMTQEQMKALALEIDVSIETVEAAYTLFRNQVVYLDGTINDSDSNFYELFGDCLNHEKGPEAIVIEHQEASKLLALTDKMTNALNPREATIIKMRHLADKPQTLHQLSETFGVSIERVRQIESKALEKMKVAA